MIKRFEVLDSFRGGAALIVVVHNMKYSIDSFAQYQFFINGHWLVEFFFILSGFVLAHNYIFKEKYSIKDFIIARTYRLFPLHIFMLGVILLIEMSKYIAYTNGLNFNTEPFSGATNFSEIIPNLLLLQSWLSSVEHATFNLPSWSISIEYYIYILFFITIYLRNKSRVLLWSFIIIFSLSSLVYGNIMLNNYILRGLSSFFIGVLLYVLYKKIEKDVKFSKVYFSIFEILLIIFTIFIVIVNIEYKSILVNIIFSATILIYSFEKGIVSKYIKNKIFTHIGKLSYSIYMIHFAIIQLLIASVIVTEKIFNFSFSVIIDGKRYIDFGSVIYNNIAIIMILGIVVWLSNYTYKHIELRYQLKGKILKERLNDNTN